MKVLNVHECRCAVAPEALGSLLDTLASEDDRLWPREVWPPMRMDGPLAPGARGGHGPIRYEVVSYQPGRSIRFRFTGPRGFHGHHALEIGEHSGQSVLRHIIEMKTSGAAILSWPFLFRPLHDALIRDSFAKARASLGLPPEPSPWSFPVRVLRRLGAGRRARPQSDLLAGEAEKP